MIHLKKTSAYIQLLLMLLIQLYAAVPGYARLFVAAVTTEIHCSGDHVKCGCSVERVAAKNCCCYQNHKVKSEPSELHVLIPRAERNQARSCCSKNVQPPVKKSCCSPVLVNEEGQNTDDRPALSSIPCGSDPRFAATALDTVKFLPSGQPVIPMVSAYQSEYLFLNVSYMSQSIPPPDPPPKLS